MEPTAQTAQDQLTLDSIMDGLCRQLDSDTQNGVIGRCNRDDMTRVVNDCVQSLWSESRIKTYIPVLALRRARDEIRTLEIARPRPT